MSHIIKTYWEALKKWASWDVIKGLICGVLPLIGFLYFYVQWMNLVFPLMEEYSKAMNKATTVVSHQHDAVVTLCIVAGLCGPLFLAFPIMDLGLWVGKASRFYRDHKTIRITWDNKKYNVRDMSASERKQISDLLSNYKSKVELRKERLASRNWFYRNFG